MPLFQRKQTLVDAVDLHGVLHIHLGKPEPNGYHTYFTRLDQALMTWGIATATIFFIAQFYHFDWTLQTALWSALSCVALILSGKLAWFWVITRNQRWILYQWSLLIIIGLALTNYAILVGWGRALGHLCTLWLVISTLGYGITSLGLKAPALLLIGGLHVMTIPFLLIWPAWQFLITGIIMSGSLLCLAAFQWQHQ